MEQKTHPYKVEETPGVKYYCKCGRSKKMPYCDGSHKGTDIEPYVIEIKERTKVAICACGLSKKLLFCDGSHKSLQDRK